MPTQKSQCKQAKEDRFRSADERKNAMQCGRCDKFGHNQKKCKNRIPEEMLEPKKAKKAKCYPNERHRIFFFRGIVRDFYSENFAVIQQMSFLSLMRLFSNSIIPCCTFFFVKPHIIWLSLINRLVFSIIIKSYFLSYFSSKGKSFNICYLVN